jgi:hypothetical protein
MIMSLSRASAWALWVGTAPASAKRPRTSGRRSKAQLVLAHQAPCQRPAHIAQSDIAELHRFFPFMAGCWQLRIILSRGKETSRLASLARLG